MYPVYRMVRLRVLGSGIRGRVVQSQAHTFTNLLSFTYVDPGTYVDPKTRPKFFRRGCLESLSSRQADAASIR